MAVLGKRQNFRLWQGGHYGNKLRAWRNIDDLLDSGYPGPVTIRYLGDIGGGWCLYDVPTSRVAVELLSMISQGAEPELVMFNEGIPNRSIVLQGELWTGADRLYWMRYSRVKLKMRDALAEKTEVSQGIKSLNLVKSAMSPSSWADFELLIERYPDHAIEFTVTSGTIGDTPGRNAVVWEIRRY
jgi:hypothetical protein